MEKPARGTAERQTIEVTAYRDPHGEPTCCLEAGRWCCQFLETRKYGTVDVCGITGRDIERTPAYGWTRPHDGCLVWRQPMPPNV
jgi:hypothetical protein